MKQTTFSLIYFFVDHLHKTKCFIKQCDLISVIHKHDTFVIGNWDIAWHTICTISLKIEHLYILVLYIPNYEIFIL